MVDLVLYSSHRQLRFSIKMPNNPQENAKAETGAIRNNAIIK